MTCVFDLNFDLALSYSLIMQGAFRKGLEPLNEISQLEGRLAAIGQVKSSGFT